MPFRALASSLLCVSALWPVCALACINAMDDTAKDFSKFFGVDLLLWSVGAVFLNRVVLRDLRGSAAAGRPQPSGSRRVFSVLVGAAFILLLAIVSAGGTLLEFSSEDFATCAPSLSMVVALVALPAALFSLHGAFFHELSRQLAGAKGGRVVVGMVLTSLLLVLGFSIARWTYIIPRLCQAPTPFFTHSGY